MPRTSSAEGPSSFATVLDPRDGYRNRPAGFLASRVPRRIDDAFDEIETGTEVLVISDRDIDAHLLRYQIERGRALDWAHEDPDAEPREVRVSKQEPLGDGELGTFDVRDLIPQRRRRGVTRYVQSPRIW